MASLPYITAPGNIEKAFNGIKSAATPERITQDFVKTILKIPGGSGDQVTAFLKKLGFSNSDGTPSDIYKKFRNGSSSKKAAAEALRFAYAPLYKRNEYMHELSDDQLKGLIIEETGQGQDSAPVALVLSSIKAIKKFCDFSIVQNSDMVEKKHVVEDAVKIGKIGESNDSSLSRKDLGFNLSYTINLNLPATSDIAVFNAIFKSLKDNLLSGGGNG